MATLIPPIGTCISRMTAGERRLAERLEQKLDDDYLLWSRADECTKELVLRLIVSRPEPQLHRFPRLP